MSDEQRLKFDDPALKLWLRILSVTKLIENEVRGNLRESFKTTLPRFDVMAELYRYHPKGLRMGEISQNLMVTNGNITGIIDQLAKEGLAERSADPDDGRVFVVRLTSAGKKRFEKMARLHRDWIDGLMAGLNAEERDQLLELLSKLRNSLPERLDKAHE
ncbi:MAG TPA: MarR family transcriptional regulator [Phototrophicaceae bacterium]|nr:MarR family transcriptional regulator [Phototrophicaceae bacterium]